MGLNKLIFWDVTFSLSASFYESSKEAGEISL